MIKKTDSKWVPLATVSILGQPPKHTEKTQLQKFYREQKMIETTVDILKEDLRTVLSSNNA